MLQKDDRLPVMFVGHGSPMNAIGRNRANESWKNTGSKLGKPPVIIAVSAHWTTHGTAVRTASENKQIYDMYGFPKELYEVHYEPQGAPEYAARVLELLGGYGHEDNSWGIDHGIWSVLSNMYPDADVPVVMVSTDVDASPEKLLATGQKLAALRSEGAMIIASGNVVHNLRMVDWGNENGEDWADAFDHAITDAVRAGDTAAVINYEKLEGSRLAVPTTEHFAPLLIALGAAEGDDRVVVWNEYRELGSMSMTSFIWG
ncbi:MAG: 4,5-DOPA dioxygenase extradiol [Anaerovoracaceae bacterium]